MEKEKRATELHALKQAKLEAKEQTKKDKETLKQKVVSNKIIDLTNVVLCVEIIKSGPRKGVECGRLKDQCKRHAKE